MFSPRYLAAYWLAAGEAGLGSKVRTFRGRPAPLFMLLLLCLACESLDVFFTPYFSFASSPPSASFSASISSSPSSASSSRLLSGWVLMLRLALHGLLLLVIHAATQLAPNRTMEKVSFEFQHTSGRWVKRRNVAPPLSRLWPLPSASFVSTPRFWSGLFSLLLGHSWLSLLHDGLLLLLGVDSWGPRGKWLGVALEAVQLGYGLSLALPSVGRQQRWRLWLGAAFFCLGDYLDLFLAPGHEASGVWAQLLFHLPLHAAACLAHAGLLDASAEVLVLGGPSNLSQ